jgi:Beta-propeller repeat
VDAQGNAYITGSTGSLDFPMKKPAQAAFGGSGDAFVVKLSATGTALLYSTYLGGNASDIGNGIAVDDSGNAYVLGTTFSTNFPTKAAFQSAKGAQQDAFLAKLNASGSSLAYSTFLGGNNVDEGNGIAVDAAGNAYVTGYTASTNFPVQSPFRGSNAGGVDAFVAKMNPAGSALVYSTYLGGSETDYGTAIAVDAVANAYVTGIVTSDDFPEASPIDSKLGSHAVDDVFVTKSRRVVTRVFDIFGGRQRRRSVRHRC